MSVIGEAGTVYLAIAPKCIPPCLAQSLVSVSTNACLFILFLLVIVFYILRFTASDYPFDIVNHVENEVMP